MRTDDAIKWRVERLKQDYKEQQAKMVKAAKACDVTPQMLHAYLRSQHLWSIAAKFGLDKKLSDRGFAEAYAALVAYVSREVLAIAAGAASTGELNSTGLTVRYSRQMWLEACGSWMEWAAGR